jgi:hypothetical protein
MCLYKVNWLPITKHEHFKILLTNNYLKLLVLNIVDNQVYIKIYGL